MSTHSAVVKMLQRVVAAHERTFPREFGFYRSVSCPHCGDTTSEHDASNIWHRPDCLMGDARQMLRAHSATEDDP
jgi:hypothetical protein